MSIFFDKTSETMAGPSPRAPVMPANQIPLPNFIIAGAQKSGTTSLHTYLSYHTAIFLPEYPQEIHFFDTDANYQQGINHYAQYFRPAQAHHEAIGQTSPRYIYEPKAAYRIATMLPDVKLIFILRNPISRAYSHYWHSVKKGYETLSFEAALAAEPERLQQGPQARSQFSYADRGFYSHQLQRYLQYFSHEQLLLLITESMSQNIAQTINCCCDFLALAAQGRQIAEILPQQKMNMFRLPRSQRLQQLIAPFRHSPNQAANKLVWWIDRLNLRTVPYPPMDPATREKLAARFMPENAQLAAMFDLDLSMWAE